jgi:hypothetical protein
LKPSINNHKYSYRLPVTCDYVCSALGITEKSFNRSLSLLTEKRMPTKSALEHCEISRSNLVALHKYFSTEKIFRNYLVESLEKKNGKTVDIGKFKGFLKEEENSSFEEKILYALNRRASSKLKKVREGSSFNIKRANCVHFEKIPDGQPIRRLIFFYVFWYNPQTQKVMKAKSLVMSDIKKLHKPYYTEEELREKMRGRYYQAAKEVAFITWSRFEKAEAERKAREAVLERRRLAKEKKRQRREELDALYRQHFLRRMVRCEENKWASRVQYLHWRCKDKFLKALQRARSILKARKQILQEIKTKVAWVPPVKMFDKYANRTPFDLFGLLSTKESFGVKAGAAAVEDEVVYAKEEKVEETEQEHAPAPRRPRPKKLEGEELLISSTNNMRGKYNLRENKGAFFTERRNLGGGKAVVDDEVRRKRLLEVWEDVLVQGTETWIKDTLLYSNCSRDLADRITQEVLSRIS